MWNDIILKILGIWFRRGWGWFINPNSWKIHDLHAVGQLRERWPGGSARALHEVKFWVFVWQQQLNWPRDRSQHHFKPISWRFSFTTECGNHCARSIFTRFRPKQTTWRASKTYWGYAQKTAKYWISVYAEGQSEYFRFDQSFTRKISKCGGHPGGLGVQARFGHVRLSHDACS